ncbi:MAG: hypothetical protein ABW208_23125 [Pyrinomonadaceae bacterium]
MSGKKCQQCGLVNWPDAAACGRCGATLAASASTAGAAEAVPGWIGGVPRILKWQLARALMWGFVLYGGLASLCFGLMALYDRITGAPPAPTGPLHSPPANPFFYLAVLVIYSAPVTYGVIALLLYGHFGRREAARRARE